MIKRWYAAIPSVVRLQLLLAVTVVLWVLIFRFAGANPALAELMVKSGGFWKVIGLGATCLGMSPEQAFGIVCFLGYWLILGTVIVYIVLATNEARQRWADWGAFWRECVRPHWVGLLVAFLAALFWQVNEPHEFKILFDEHVLAATSREMHFERQAAYRAISQFQNGQIYTEVPMVDKRPVLFPFCVSVLHDLTGYRPENVFVLNGLLGFVLLVLIYAVGVGIGGPKIGLIGQALLIGLPLLPQNATGGGYEILNLCFMCGLFLAGARYWRRPGAAGLDFFIFTAILLAQVRYESILYLLVLPVVVILKWCRDREITMTWLAALSPLFVVPPLMVNEVFLSNEGNFQTTADNFMRLSYLPDNLQHAVYFMFSISDDFNNSWLLSAVGSLATILVLVLGLLRLRQWRQASPTQVMIGAIAPFILLNTGLILCMFWGHWDESIVSRFSFSLQLLLCFNAMVLASWFNRAGWLPRWLGWTILLWGVVASAPVSARATGTKQIQTNLIYNWACNYILKNSDQSVMIISRANLLFIVNQRASVSTAVVNRHPWRVTDSLDAGLYSDVWVVREEIIDAKSNRWVPNGGSALDGRLITEPIPGAEFHALPFMRVRIMRVVGYDPSLPSGVPGPSKDDYYPGGPALESVNLGQPIDAVDTIGGVETENPAVPEYTDLPTDYPELAKKMFDLLPR